MSGIPQKPDPARPAIPALQRQRLADQIADVLRHQIVLGDLKPGSAIHERETSDALGVSRTPLREALLILEADGLITMAPAHSPVVVDPSLEDLTQMLLVQSALEGLAGEIACESSTEEELAEIEALHESLLAASPEDDPLAFFKIDMNFHKSIVAATKNPPLIRTHEQYHARLWRARYMASSTRIRRSKTLHDHTQMVEGLRERDKEKTSSALSQHLRQAIVNITAIFNEENKN